MIKLFGSILGAFFLFILVFPLAGFLFTLLLKVILPYLLVPAAVAAVVKHAAFPGDFTGIVVFCGVGWIVLLQMARMAFRRRNSSLQWHQGHYRAMLTVLTLGIPFWAGKIAVEAEADELAGKPVQLQPSATD